MSVVETSSQVNPLALDAYGYYCTLKFMEYKRPKPFDTAKENVVFTAVLPLPNELRDNTSAEFSSPTALNAVGDLVNGVDLAHAGAASVLRNSEAIMDKIGKAGSAGAKAALSKFGSVGQAAGNVVGGAVGGIDTKSIATVIQQGLGVAPNPNQSISFEGPSLRRHDFSWTFQPNNEKESLAVKKLIKKLKTLSLPSTALSSGAAILKYPHMCIMNFYPWDSNPSAENIYGWSENSIIKIKKCFVAGVNVNYSPAGVPGFFEGSHMPFAISVSIPLIELEYMLAEDFDPSVKSKMDLADPFIEKAKSLGSSVLEKYEENPELYNAIAAGAAL